MTVYGWDASNHDWSADRSYPRSPMDLARARSEGIALFTHKAGEGAPGWYDDPYLAPALDRARKAGIPVIGAYYAMHGGDNQQQCADHFVDLVSKAASWWPDATFVWQLDAEPFKPFAAPTKADIEAFGYRLENAHGIQRQRILVYAPEWVYGDGLVGTPWRLWQSNYVSGSAGFKSMYPGDTSTRWHGYSGQTPLILQYTSSAIIAGQGPSDANAIRVASEAELVNLFEGDTVMDAELKAYLDARFADVNHGITLIVYGDSKEAAMGQKPQGHPFNLFQIYGKEGDLHNDVAAVQASAVTRADVAALNDEITAAVGNLQASLDAFAAAVADKIVAALPASTLTKDDVSTAVRDVLSTVHLTPETPSA